MGEVDIKSFEESFFNALNLFNNQKWYEAHDAFEDIWNTCLLYTSPSPRDRTRSRMPSSA